MTKLFNGLWLGLFAAALVGCQSAKGEQDLADAPPPVYEQDFEPVQVQAPTKMTVDPDAATVSVPDTTTFNVPEPSGDSYTVQRGDTLWSIAVRHYGDGQRWVDIAEANGITDQARLPVGKKLVLPY